MLIKCLLCTGNLSTHLCPFALLRVLLRSLAPRYLSKALWALRPPCAMRSLYMSLSFFYV